MSDIEGLDNAMEVLRPHWGDIDAETKRHKEQYLAMAATDHEVLGRVLRAHLIIENYLNSYLVDLFGFENFGDLRLTFSQKAKMVPQSKTAAMLVRPGILQINDVRNKYSHRLDHTIGFPAISEIIKFLSWSRSGQEFKTPIEAIEAFAPIAGVFLTVQPKHLSEAFAQAMSHIHIPTPLENG